MTATADTTAVRRPRFGLGKIERHNLKWGLLFISPWLFGFVVLGIFPILYTFVLSLTRYGGIRPPIFIGAQNYQRIVADPIFWKSVYNTLYYTVLAVPIGAAIAMILALAMNRRIREIALYRGIFYLPSILPVFAISFVFVVLLNPGYGLVNLILTSLGLPSPDWLGNPDYTKLALVMIAQLGAGQWALVFLAALRAIPVDLYESADIDGAGTWRKFRSITLPLMTPVILYDLIIGISFGLQVFTSAYILTGGGGFAAGADNSLLTYVFYLFKQAFQFGQLGYAAAMSVILFVFSLLLAGAVFRWSRSWVFYGGEEA
jgi:multiple sugar transport system permease protein